MIFPSSFIQARRQRAAQALSPYLTDEHALLILCGDPITKPGGLDQTYDFLPLPEYYWLTGSRRPQGALYYSAKTGWVDFVKPVSLEEKLWEGGGNGDDMQGRPAEARPVSELNDFLKQQKHRRLVTLGREASDIFNLQVQEALNQARRIKDQAEIDLIVRAGLCAARGYERVTQMIKTESTERLIQIEYEAEVLRAGADGFPYGTLVGSGVNASVLHATPSSKKIARGDLILMDAGAEIKDYCVDITRMFWADGKPNTRQFEIYSLVLKAQLMAIENCRVGVEWHEIHRVAARVMAEGLKFLNLLRGDVEEILESGAISVFFPHGVGHMVGQRVRDVGRDILKPVRSTCGVNVRVDFPLEQGFVMTVEPGIYFPPALIGHHRASRKFDSWVNWGEVEKWMDFGGVRIEDDILVTAKDPQVLTSAVPK